MSVCALHHPAKAETRVLVRPAAKRLQLPSIAFGQHRVRILTLSRDLCRVSSVQRRSKVQEGGPIRLSTASRATDLFCDFATLDPV